MNRRFLGYVACATHFPHRQELDPELIKFVAEIQRQFPVLFSGALAFLELTQPGPNHWLELTGFLEIVSDDFPLLHTAEGAGFMLQAATIKCCTRNFAAGHMMP